MTVRLGFIGLGFMGQTHLRAATAAAKDGVGVEVVAVSDSSAERRTGLASASGNLGTGAADERLFDPAVVRAYEDPAAMLSHPGLDAVVISTPTDTHEILATRALRAGLHVLLEKPVAIAIGPVREIQTTEAAGKARVLPAMCMRFWPGWTYLKQCIDDRRHGVLTALHLTRLGSRPTWSPFYADEARCGGAIFDLHIHDADFVLHALGMPREVLSVGSIDHVTTMYRYGNAVQVTARGGWLDSPGRGFRMRYSAEFERATVEFDLGRTPTVGVTSDGLTAHPDLPILSGYDEQLRHFVECVSRWDEEVPADPRATLDDAVAVTRLIDAERRSVRSGRAEAV